MGGLVLQSRVREEFVVTAERSYHRRTGTFICLGEAESHGAMSFSTISARNMFLYGLSSIDTDVDHVWCIILSKREKCRLKTF